MRYIIVFILCFAAAGIAKPFWKSDKENPGLIKQQHLDSLNAQLQSARDSLKSLISGRWETKQSYVARRNTDKEQLAALREAQERAYIELARMKEEVFARERTIEDERNEIKNVRESWRIVGLTIEDEFQKEAKELPGTFPLGTEERRKKIEQARNILATKGIIPALQSFMQYYNESITKGTEIQVSRETILPENGRPVNVQFVRFGNLFGYGMNSENEAWIVSQTGSLGEGRFRVDSVVSAELHEFLRSAVPRWISNETVSGIVMADIIQNAKSRNLVSGVRSGRIESIRNYVKKGGVVMLPLLLLPLWAIVIVILKTIQLGIQHRSGKRLSRKIVKCLEKKDIAGAKKLIAGHKGAVTNVVTACLEHSEWDRQAAEKAVKEIMVDEVPHLNRNLSTLAVIAGAAPLLGLLGTVTGMISLFEVITNYGTGDPKIMAGGISEALITTQTGLIVAIPILLVHNILRNRKNRIQEEMERNAIKILNRLWPEEVYPDVKRS